MNKVMNKDLMAKNFRDFLTQFRCQKCDGECDVCSFNDKISFEGGLGSAISVELCAVLMDLANKF
jgi:hypothetical protein